MYHGYKNYATWSVFNYISNVETAYNHYQTVYHEKGDDVEALARVLSDDFKDESVIDANANTLNALYKSILDDAISEIDFDEIARAFVE